nr:MAG TPA: DNA N-6-adenine-methyltransferase [Caudoviricetes sp.]
MRLKLAPENQTRVWKNLRHCSVRGIFYTRFLTFAPSPSWRRGFIFRTFQMGIRQQTIDDYGAFVEKFKPKKTTDDCYTPPAVYETIKDWACREFGIDPSKVVRPFYPGGDYESFDYSGGKVVVDNPPFSILSKICAFYRDRGIPFFLFAPNLTIFSSTSRNGAHMLVTDCAIEYANGAIVNTGFVTSFGDDLIRTAPDLTKLVNDAVKRVRRKSRKHLPKYAYPPELLTVTRLNKVGNAGLDFRVKASDVAFTRALDSQKAVKKAIYGGGYLLSEAKAAELKAAELKAAEDVTVWPLNDKEQQIIGKLG